MRSISLALLALPVLASATSYTVEKVYSGSNFFDDWIFYNNFDNLTNGDAMYDLIFRSSHVLTRFKTASYQHLPQLQPNWLM
jgi:hypothetical protein